MVSVAQPKLGATEADPLPPQLVCDARVQGVGASVPQAGSKLLCERRYRQVFSNE